MLRNVGLCLLGLVLVSIMISEPSLALTPPQAAFTYYPQPPLIDELVTFNASSSTTAGPGITIVNFEWDFGDGTPKVNTPQNATTHVFIAPANYTVILNVTDSQGLWNTTSKIVTIYALDLTVATDQPVYEKSDVVDVSGTFAWLPIGLPVLGALIGVEIRDPAGSAFLFRTRPTSAVGGSGWLVNFTSFYPCNSSGFPKYSFIKGESIWIFAEWKNYDLRMAHPVTTCIIPFDSNNAPIGDPNYAGGILEPNSVANILFQATSIKNAGILGTVTLYASLFSDFPMNGGYPYCPEAITTFTISASASLLESNSTQSLVTAGSDGTYGFSFKFPFVGTPVGEYTVYASTSYYSTELMESIVFDVFVMGDINGDGVTDIFDAILLAAAFNSVPGDLNWNPNADLNNDNSVDIFDAILLASNFEHV